MNWFHVQIKYRIQVNLIVIFTELKFLSSIKIPAHAIVSPLLIPQGPARAQVQVLTKLRDAKKLKKKNQCTQLEQRQNDQRKNDRDLSDNEGQVRALCFYESAKVKICMRLVRAKHFCPK